MSDGATQTRPKVGFHASAWGRDHLLAALHGIGRAGFDGAEIYSETCQYFRDRPEEFVDILAISDVPLAGLHGSGRLTDPSLHAKEREEWGELLSWVKKAGGDYAVYYGGESSGDGDFDLVHASKLLGELATMADENGVKFCYEAEPGCPFNSSDRITALLDRTPSNVMFSVDTARLVEFGLDPSLFLLANRARVGLLHVRDTRKSDDVRPHGGDPYVDPGTGSVDLRGIADTLRAIGYAGWIVGVVDRPLRSPMESVQNTATYFEKVLKLRA